MERLFVTFSTSKLKQLESRIQECLDRLSPEQIWWRPSEENNSVANLVLHLTGERSPVDHLLRWRRCGYS